MSAPTSPAAPTSNPDVGPAAAWTWLHAQLAGRAVPRVLTIIGLGDGSLLEALDVHAPAARVLALEPDLPPARTPPHTDRMRAWLAAGRLVYLTGPNYAGADQAWRLFPTRFEQPPLLVHPATASSGGLRDAVAVLAKIVFGVKANAEARRRFAPRYLTNSLRNIPAMLSGRDVRELSGVAAGMPAVVVGAGPSLDRSLADLRRLGPRAVVVATDTALRPLLLAGIVPQFVVALDPSELNGRHLLKLPACRDTWLVAESALDPRAAAAFYGRTFWFRVAPHEPWPWLNERRFDVGRLEVWGSVLTAGYQLACLAGCDPIVMVGADLSFPDGRPYARGTTYEYDWAWTAASRWDVEESWRKQLASRADVRVERDVNGADVPTTAVMLEFRDWLVAQAKRSRRRVVNATGRGVLFGEGVEQARLADVLAEGPTVPPLFDSEARPVVPQAAAIVESLHAVTASLTAGRFGDAPLAAWQEFSGEGFDAGRLAAGVAAALQAFDVGPLTAEAGTRDASAQPFDLTGLPESLARFRAALGGAAPAPRAATPALERAARLIIALERLRRIVHDTTIAGQEIVALPDPALVGTVPAGAIAIWPDATRWAALEFEAVLAECWDAAVPPFKMTVADHDLVPADTAVGAGASDANATRLESADGCLLLALEWLECASSLGGAEAMRPMLERLWTLEGLLRRATQSPQPPGSPVELVLVASGSGHVVQLALPLVLSDVAVSRVMAGTMRADGAHAWELGAATTGALSVRAAVQVSGGAPVVLRASRAIPVRPHRLTIGRGRSPKVAGQVPDGALCLVDFGTETMLVGADGGVEPYQSWPRLITGALSLGASGDVAWSNVWQPQRGLTPCLLYRPEPGADVVAFELAFRPARGVWWRNRLYLTVLPTRDAGGAVATWAPGEEPGIVLRDLPLQGIVPMGDELLLEPFVPGTPETVARQRAERGWRWTPGVPPEPRELGPLGASSDVAVNGDWSARAYPQADVVTLAHRDGARFELRCYNPLRVGWAEGSLIVSGAGGETVLFECLLEAIEVR